MENMNMSCYLCQHNVQNIVYLYVYEYVMS